MEIVLFLVLIGIISIVLLFLGMGSKRRKDLSKQRRSSRKEVSEKLVTPADNVLAHRDELWRMRTRGNTMDVAKTNSFVPRSAEPEYDGYSRRDRHHLTPKATHVKTEGHVGTAPTTGLSK